MVERALKISFGGHMILPDILALVIANISVTGGDFKPTPSGFTPYAKVTHIRLSGRHPVSAEGSSFFYKRSKDPAIIEGHLQDLEARACDLTARALRKLPDTLPVKDKFGHANISQISNKEFLIVVVIANYDESTPCCNALSQQIRKFP